MKIKYSPKNIQNKVKTLNLVILIFGKKNEIILLL